MRKKEIIRVLMRRDGLTETEAREVLNDAISEMRELIADGRFIEAEDAFSEVTGLEPDYIM